MIVRLLLVAVALLTGAVVAVCPASQGQEPPTPLRINELMASNGKTISDPQGEYDDWVELYNAGQQAINVAGMYLTNDLGAPTKWQFPADQPAVTTVQPHGYLLLWADGDTGDWGLHASFRLDADGDTVALYDSDGQTLIDVVQFSQQTPDVSWGRDPNDDSQWRALGLATPGSQNVNLYLGFVADVKFSCERGFYEQPFSVTLTTATEGAAICYTTDGSLPFNDARAQPTGRLYTGPVPITTTTCLRAIAFKPQWNASRVGTQTYIFLDDVIRQPARPPGWPTTWGHTGSGDYEMDPDVVNDPRYSGTIEDGLKSVATLSLVTDRNNWFGPNGQGIYLQGELVERPVSAELIFPDEREGFQIDCAVMIVGGTSPDRWKMDKLSMRLKFMGDYGPPSLQFPMFGDEATDQFDTVVLDAGMNNTWAYGGDVSPADQRRRGQYTHDQFVCDIQNAMGGYAPHGRHVHLYLNGLYWGLYWVHERPDEHFASAYLGGSDEDYDVLKHNSGSVINGSGTNYNEMFSVANAGLASDAQYAKIRQYLDVPNFIDYVITNYYIGNTDWAHQNWYATRNRVDPAGRWRYHTWDAEHVMETLDEDCTGKDDSGGPTHLHRKLAENAEYRLLFADHIYRHLFNDGILTPAGAATLYQIRLAEVDRAVVGESARWGDNQEATPRTRDVDWVRERDSLLNTYFPQRTGIVLNQFKSRGWYPNVDPPAFRVDGAARHGGHLTGGESLSMAAAAGTIWYTLDGNDPRVPGSAPPASEVTLISENAAKRVLVPTGPFNDAWRGGAVFDDSGWISGAGGVGYEKGGDYGSFFRINVGDAMYGKNTSCYIRIPFTLTSATLASIGTLTLRVRYDDGFVAYLNGTEVQRALADGTPTWNSGASGSHLDSDAIVFENFDLTGHLNALREGDNLLAIHALNQATTSSDFLLSVELTATPKGGSSNPSGVAPTAVQYASPATLTKSVCVKARVLSGTTWSALNEAVFAVGPVAESLRISEIMYHPADTGNPDDPNTEFIELTNIGSAKINLNLVRFTNGVDFIFPSFDLAPGAYCLVVKDTAAFTAKHGSGLPVVGQYSGSLNNTGERIELLDAAGAVIQNFRFEDNWFDITDGLGFSLTARSPKTTDPNSYGSKDAWRPSAHAGGSPGTDDSGQVPLLGSIVINELLANSQGSGPDWIELYNTTTQAINIGGWFLSDDANDLTKYKIAAGTSIAAGGYKVFHEDKHFGNSADPGCKKPFALSRTGETVYLHSGSGGVLTGYSEQEKFDASEAGVTLGRYQKSTGTYNFVALSRATPGAANAAPQVGPVVINEIMYHPDAPADAEYVELLNISSQPVTLYDADRELPWRFTDDPEDPSIELLFPTDPPVTLAAGEYLLLVKDVAMFSSKYTAPAGVKVLAWGLGNLADGGEKIELSKPDDPDGKGNPTWIRVDRVVYSDGSHPQDFPEGVDPWPAQADGNGSSLSRTTKAAYGNDPANWHTAQPSPGRANL